MIVPRADGRTLTTTRQCCSSEASVYLDACVALIPFPTGWQIVGRAAIHFHQPAVHGLAAWSCPRLAADVCWELPKGPILFRTALRPRTVRVSGAFPHTAAFRFATCGLCRDRGRDEGLETARASTVPESRDAHERSPSCQLLLARTHSLPCSAASGWRRRRSGCSAG